jgi:hypothetical protein
MPGKVENEQPHYVHGAQAYSTHESIIYGDNILGPGVNCHTTFISGKSEQAEFFSMLESN